MQASRGRLLTNTRSVLPAHLGKGDQARSVQVETLGLAQVDPLRRMQRAYLRSRPASSDHPMSGFPRHSCRCLPEEGNRAVTIALQVQQWHAPQYAGCAGSHRLHAAWVVPTIYRYQAIWPWVRPTWLPGALSMSSARAGASPGSFATWRQAGQANVWRM